LKQSAKGIHKADERRCVRLMSEQARKIEHEAIPQWAQGLYYNKGLFSEALIYHDDEALYFELRGKEDSIVRLSFEMLETLSEVIEEEQEHETSPEGKRA
jgi:hypothetical protein